VFLPRLLFVVLGAAGLVARADADPGVLSPIRREMLAEYRYAPKGTPPAELPTSLHSQAPAAPAVLDPGIVPMDRYEVLASRDAVWPHESPAAPGAAPTPPTVASRLGIGIHRARVGKIEVFATTVFYVPILVGFAW
jgi:hypothetical protein